LQNNRALSQATAGYKTAKNQTVTWKNFAMKRLRGCKKSDGLCLMKNLQAIESGKTAF